MIYSKKISILLKTDQIMFNNIWGIKYEPICIKYHWTVKE